MELLPHEAEINRRIHDMSFLREVVDIEGDIVSQQATKPAIAAPQPVFLPIIKRPKIPRKEAR
jgi:hypothetical protein